MMAVLPLLFDEVLALSSTGGTQVTTDVGIDGYRNTSQNANSIILNATGGVLQASVAGFIVNPVRSTGTTPVIMEMYDLFGTDFVLGRLVLSKWVILWAELPTSYQ